MERDCLGIMSKNYCVISTHTLTWSVTVIAIIAPYIEDISTHTLTWSVTILFKVLTAL